jgi:hypothetical protein
MYITNNLGSYGGLESAWGLGNPTIPQVAVAQTVVKGLQDDTDTNTKDSAGPNTEGAKVAGGVFGGFTLITLAVAAYIFWSTKKTSEPSAELPASGQINSAKN